MLAKLLLQFIIFEGQQFRLVLPGENPETKNMYILLKEKVIFIIQLTSKWSVC